jgi:7-cyano-7-deazaguanine synthase
MNKVVVPISGGMDSTVLLYKAKNKFDEVYALSFNYNQRHSKELDYAIKTTSLLKIPHQVLDISFFRHIASASALTNNNIAVAKAKDVMGDPQTPNYVPNRNMMMLSIAVAYAETIGASTVYHGAAQVDSVAGYWDGSQEFLGKINDLLFLNRRNKIQIEAPLIELSKKEIIELGISLNVSFKDTWTCYEGKDKACAVCTACSLRLKGFIDAGYKDPLDYSIQIPWPVGLKDL